MDLANSMQSVIPSAHGAVLGVLARTDEPLEAGAASPNSLDQKVHPNPGERRSSKPGAMLA